MTGNLNPSISVLMSVFNSEKYLKEAIESILNQTFTNFEFLIINDGSNDDSRNIILSFSDPRIVLIDNENNIGLTRSLNKGIESARGKYIARMDADDISMPTRLEKQVNFLNENLQIGLLGTWFEYFPGGPVIKPPCKHEEIYAQLFKNNPVAHPSVMLRRSVLIENKCLYNNKFKKAQDYELWSRLIEKTRVANLPEVLLLYRVHQGQISNFANDEQLLVDTEVKVKLYSRLLDYQIDPKFTECLIKLNNSSSKLSNDEFVTLKTVFDKAFNTAKKLSSINSELFLMIHTSLIVKVFNRTQNRSLKLIPSLLGSPFFWSSSNRVKAAYFHRILKDTFTY